MKKMGILITLVVALTSIEMVSAKCINKKHVASKPISGGAPGDATVEYTCLNKGNDDVYDKKGVCKNCGCVQDEHDNT
jgi:hypothetical protein